MRKLLILVAVIAICHAAPHRQKRDEDHSIKPDSVKAHEGLQHSPAHAVNNAKILPVTPAVAPIKTKRDIPVPTEVKTTAAPKEDNEKPKVETLIPHIEDHAEHNAKVHEHHQATPAVAVAKTKRDIPVPTEVKTTAAPKEDNEKPKVETLIPHIEDHAEHNAKVHEHHQATPAVAVAKTKRDIPVPTEVKTTAAPKEDKEKPQVPALVPQIDEHAASTPHHAHSPLRHHPVPVAELFNKSKTTGSSEESKESAESKETKA